MVDKRVFVKNIRSWFTDRNTKENPRGAPLKITSKSNLKTGYVGYFNEVNISINNQVYLFTSQAWFHGINTQSNKKSISITGDKSASVVSIMPTTDVPTRKIVDRIKISCDKNIVAKHLGMLEFTILRVKSSIYTPAGTDNYKTNGLRNPKSLPGPPLLGFKNETNDLATHQNDNICSGDTQLVKRGSFFSSSEVTLDNLDYDLGLDDLVLIQKISFDKSIEEETVGGFSPAGAAGPSLDLYFGIARKEFADYRVEVDYSYGYI